MDQIASLLVTSALILLPLIPAAFLYLILSPKQAAGGADGNTAKGTLDSGTASPWKFKFQFNVVGSTATYVVLLLFSFLIFDRLDDERTRADALKDQQAWLVEVPVRLMGPGGATMVADTGQLQQVRVELEPSLTTASSNSLQFWVISNNERFPTARLTIPSSVKPSILDLNDMRRVDRQYDKHKLSGIEPVWLQMGQPYAAQ